MLVLAQSPLQPRAAEGINGRSHGYTTGYNKRLRGHWTRITTASTGQGFGRRGANKVETFFSRHLPKMNIAQIIKNVYHRHPSLPFYSSARAIYSRLRTNQKELYYKFRSVHLTKPLRCNPNSRTELHALTCHNHLFMYITAVKSLLRFVSDVALVVHDDGSLTAKDIARIKHHVEGIKVIRRRDADRITRELLGPFPKTRNYRAAITNSLELTDHALFAGREKLLIINSDVLFLQRPDEVIQWMASDNGEVICVYEEEPRHQAAFLARARSSFPAHVTLALVGLYKDIVDPAETEELLNYAGPSHESWYLGQNALAALIGRKIEPNKLRFLDQRLYQASGVFTEGAVFRHYWTSMASLRKQHFADAAKVIADLK